MIDTPKRTGYRLTYDAECLYNDWQEIGGCSCHTGCAPCSSCTHDGNPISLEENDEAWEKDTVGELVKVRVNPKYFHEIVRYIPYSHGDPIGRWSIFEARACFDGWLIHDKVFHKKVFDIVDEETEMSRSCITDKGSGMQPPLPQEFKVGKYYKCVEDRKDLRKGDLYKVVDIVSSVGQPLLKLVNSKGSYLQSYSDWFDVNSESDYDPNTAQPTGYTAYVVFKQDFTKGAIKKGEYGGKEYAYKCSRDDYLQVMEYAHPFNIIKDGTVFAEVPAYDKIKTVKVVRVEAKVDPVATKSIVKILPKVRTDAEKELAKDVGTGRIQTVVKVSINRDDLLQHKHTGNNATTNVGDVNMSTTQRKVVKVELFDNDAGLPVENSLVFYKADVITEDSDSVTVQEIIASGEIAKLITKHNELRGKTTDLEVQKRTGQSVKLQPIKLKNLVWKVDGRIVG